MAVWKASSAGAGFVEFALEQDFAAQEMREWQTATNFSSARESQRLVDARERAARPERLQLELRELRDHEPMAAQQLPAPLEGRQRPPQFGCPGCRIMEATTRTDGVYFGNIAPPRHPVLSAENLKSLSRRQSGGGVVAQHFEEEFGLERMGHRWSVAELGCAAVYRLDQFARAFDLAQLPHRYAEPGHRNQAGVLAEAFARLRSRSGSQAASTRSQSIRASANSPSQ